MSNKKKKSKKNGKPRDAYEIKETDNFYTQELQTED